MLTEDYLLRQITQATAALARVLGLSRAGHFEQAQQLIDQSLEELVGLKAGLVQAMDDQSLIRWLTCGSGADAQRLSILADLFAAEGDVLAGLGRSRESRASYARALGLYLELSSWDTLPHAPDQAARIEALRRKLGA